MFKCEKCESAMIEDYMLTAKFFDDKMTEIFNDDGEIEYKNIPYEIYISCGRCGYSKLISVNEIVEEILRKPLKALLYHRLSYVYKNVEREGIDEANGVSHCGMCQGVIDGTGICYNDVIERCSLRKRILKEK
jgi:hypothetical protein